MIVCNGNILKLQVTKIGHFSGHADSIYALAVRRADQRFYSGSADGMVVQWDHVKKGDGILVMKALSSVYSLLILNSGKKLLAGTSKGQLHLADIESNVELKLIDAHQGGIFDLQSVGEFVYSCGEDGFVAKWDGEMGLISRWQVSKKSVRVIRSFPETNLLICGCSDHSIKILDKESGKIIQTLDAHTNSVFSLCLTSKYLFSGGRDANIYQWDIKTIELIKQIPAHTLHVNYLDYNIGNKLMLSCSMDKTIKIWDAETMELLKVIDHRRNESHINCVNKVLWIDAKHFISCGDDRAVMMFEISMSE